MSAICQFCGQRDSKENAKAGMEIALDWGGKMNEMWGIYKNGDVRGRERRGNVFVIRT